ncbi:hypothetical protein Taro_024179 [Colocasia esculenta]|uniref:ENTH domain-containing protein n=1 Tax=Colocasia esculenta TaxID=4460 RepID=A0A843V648_COLES|nr:hypothetical protein [Colocasia esculenta]
MAPPSSIRKVLGAVKDQTSIGIAKVSSTMAPELDVAIVKATGHDDEPADEKHLREIVSLTSYSRGHVNACIATISRRLGKTHDWIVALKSLMLVHRLLADGDPTFQQEILYATRKGTRLLNMSDFRDEAHSHSWDHSAFVRTYALYLDQRLECMLYERKQGTAGGGSGRGERNDHPYSREDPQQQQRWGEDPYAGGSNGNYGARNSYSSPGAGGGYGGDGGYGERQQQSRGEERKPPTPVRDMRPERVLGRMHQLQLLLDRFLACRPTGMAKNSRMVLIALYPVIRESFQLYADICEILAVLLDRFFDMEYPDCVKAFEAYASAAKQIDELASFYGWCKETGVARSSEYPEVQRITDKLLETLEEFMRDRARRPKSPERVREEAAPAPPVEEEEPVQDMGSIKALPAPEGFDMQAAADNKAATDKQRQQVEADLVDLRDDGVTADEQGNKLALALFSGPVANGGAANGAWEAFPSSGADGNGEVTSAWQTPAAEAGKADWELALVETASNLSKQKATLAGGFDPLLLNGMYDAGAVRQHVSTQMSSGGSASSVALPGLGRNTAPVLALPAPDGSVQAVGPHDPFAASLAVPPPAYVQMSDMEKKQHLLVQEQHLWQQYSKDGMQGQASLAKLGNQYGAPPPAMPYGMPPVYGVGYPHQFTTY